MDEYVKFFRGTVYMNEADSKARATELVAANVDVNYFKDAYGFFKNTCYFAADDSIKRAKEWGSHRLGALPMKEYVVEMFKFFRNTCYIAVNDALSEIVRWYEMTEGSSRHSLPTFAELTQDMPKYYNFFKNTCYLDQAASFKQAERLVRGLGRVNWAAFDAAYKEKRGSFKTVAESIEAAMKAVGV